MKLKRRKPQEVPARTVLLIGGPFDARTLSQPLPEVGESVLLAVDHGDQHSYLCETPGTASYTGVITEAEQARRIVVMLSAPAKDPTR